MNNHMKHSFYRKHIAILYILILVCGTIASMVLPKQEFAAAKNPLVIPKEAIRLRILANSDSEKDQTAKRAIRDAVNKEITTWVEELTSIDDARSVIQSQITDIEKIAEQQLADLGIDDSVQIDFDRVQFPTKLYGDILYPAGTYEAILITIGKGKGANWWCVLFPPLCFLDFSNSLAVNKGFDEVDTVEENVDNEEVAAKPVDEQLFVKENEEEVKVKFFIIEFFHKIF
ncbi:stage II sporulation protein R [Pseudogracilibacillus auburnensis]|uniref:stage II sporulation protein R n=1 Tax=Pseudogracilibacillus auburnensis TaxID=1494959 RepID=UPI001A979925|nr:stage II sporulation protein R [Pseudogracilibacillus auburnensis]MBO1004803.1 stage II sporulation protein R [Pseudogracilibacillus auburnensis]